VKTPTNIVTKNGNTPIYISDKPCTRCGCYEAFVFECNCGQVHSDICYNCGRFTDMVHEPVDGTDRWERRCSMGPVEHTHKTF
jgi:hypothetical protein